MAKSSFPELQARLRTVMEWILDDHTYTDIKKSILAKWDISDRQAKRYYADAYELLSEGAEHNIERKKAFYIQRKKKLIRDMDPKEKKTASGVAAINKILDSMAEIEGVKVNKHELTGKNGKDLNLVTIFELPDNGRDPSK